MRSTISRHTNTDTKALILQEAKALLLTRAYLGLSFQELADRVGIRKPSLYHHFDSKEALGLALVDDAAMQFHGWTQRITNKTPAQQLQAYVLMFRNGIGAAQRVCPVGATAGEWEALEPALQAAVRRLQQQQLQWLTGVVLAWQPEPAGEADVGKETDAATTAHTLAHQRALQINALLQGALLSARVQGDVAVFDAAVAPLQAALGEGRG